jgi:ADP-ribose pyrophosphatase
MPNDSRTLIHKGPVVDLGCERFQLPDGRPYQLEVVRHPGGAAIVALDDSDRVCLLRQYRHAGGGWLWELPAGKLDPGEAPEQTARRELEEEAGVQARAWQPLGTALTTPGFCDEVIHLYLARQLVTTAPRHQANEFIEIHWQPFTEALQWVHSGQIRDAKSMLGLLLAAAHLEQAP